MPVTTEDVAEWVRLRWTADPLLGPLKLTLGYTPPSVTDPRYAEFKITEGETLVTAGADYTREFSLQVSLFDEQGGADLRPYLLAIESAFKAMARSDVGLPGGRVLGLMHSIPAAGGDLADDPATQRGRAVLVGKSNFNLLCQG